MRLVVTGASGLLGLNLSLVAVKQGHAVVGLTHAHPLIGVPFDTRQLDLLEIQTALKTMEALHPDAVIHCAAVANLDAAERAPDLAHKLNGEVPAILAKAADRWRIPFVHISTDAVFDGKKDGYLETDAVNPLSVYARTKLQGETAVRNAYPDALIVRTVFYGWSPSGERSLGEFFLNSLQAGQSIKGFTDTRFCPLYVEDLAETILEMLAAGLNGIYHVVSPESLSKYEFGVRLAQKFGLNAELIQPAVMAEMNPDVPRSKTLLLDPGKTQQILGHDLPSIDAGIERFYQRWQEGYPAQLQDYVG